MAIKRPASSSQTLQLSQRQPSSYRMDTLQEQQFTFSSAIETCDDAADFNYEAWIEQSKSSYYASQEEKSYTGGLESEASFREASFREYHRNMVIQSAQDMPDNIYELSLRDLTELHRVVTAAQEAEEKSVASNDGRKKSWRNRLSSTESMEGAGRLLKMFLPSLSGGRKKSSCISGSPAVPPKSASENGESSMKNASDEVIKEIDDRRSHSMPRKGNKDSSYNRKSNGCYPFFNSKRYKVKRITGNERRL